jgi:hypothetical protein
VAEGDGGGTTAYSTDGIVLYTPTQAETNYTSFVLIAKKTSCIPVALTVVTTASAVSGRVYVDDILTATLNKIADHVRRRSQANVEASSDGDALTIESIYGLIQQAQESNTSATPGSLTVYRTDGTTVLGTKTISTNASADPVDGIS